MSIINFLKVLVKTSLLEASVKVGEACEYAGQKLFECEWGRRSKSIERDRWGSVGGIDADTNNGKIFRRRIMRVHENAPNLYVFFTSSISGVESI